MESLAITDPNRSYRFGKEWEISENAGSFTFDDESQGGSIWQLVTLPLSWRGSLPEIDRGIRLRNYFTVRDDLRNRNLGIYTGVLRYTCAFFINGVFVGELGRPTPDSYPGGLWDTLTYLFIPSNLIRFGDKNVLIIKVLEHYADIKFDSLTVSGIDTIRQLYFLDRFKFKLLHFLAGIICIILFIPLLYYFIIKKNELYYLYTFLSGLTYACFCFMVSFDVPPFDFPLFYGLAMVFLSLSITFIMITVWAFYYSGKKPILVWNICILASLCIAAVYFFLPGYRPKAQYHGIHYLFVYLPQIAFIILIICYNQYARRNKGIQLLFVGMSFLLLTGVYDVLFDLTGSAPVIWLSPIGVIGFSLSLYLQIANKYIEDIKVAEQDAVRLHYTEAIMDEKERLDVTLNSIGDAVICTDTNGIITLFNKAASDITSCTSGSVLSKPLTDVIQLENEDADSSTQNVLSLLVADDNHALTNPGPYVLKRCDGVRHTILITRAGIKDRSEKEIGLVWVLHNMTGREKLEMIRQRNQTLESLGHLAGGIAHDFNNILTGIMLNINLVKKMNQENDVRLRDLLSDSERAVDRATSLTHQLSAFAKGGVTLIHFRDIRPLVTSSASYALGGSSVKIAYDLAPELWYAKVDAGQISQVIYNLVLNSIQAFPADGEIRIAGENFILEEETPFLEKGPYVIIRVADNGVGIKKDHLVRIFDPYFTTKQRGTGLGLTTVYSIIKKHKGHIEISSEENKGTTVTIYLHAMSTFDKDQE